MHKIKILLAIFVLCFTANIVKANDLATIIEKSDIAKNAIIAVSVKDAKTNKIIYESNSHKLLNSASVQKIFTMKSAYEQLGRDFTYQTITYKDSHQNLYIKLDGDPSLTTGSLATLLSATKEKGLTTVNDIIIDATVLDNLEWGVGWMWDDDTSHLLPKISPFAIDENKIDITITPGKNGKKPEVKNHSKYNMPIVNILQNGDKDKINIDRYPWKSADTTYLSGSIKSQINTKLPVNAPEKLFIKALESAINTSGIKVNGTVKIAPLPQNIEKIATISSQPLNLLLANTLKNSNNFYAEMIFKKAASNFSKTTGTTIQGIEMFNKYYSDIKTEKPVIVDACGISRNNLISADWITSALNKIYKEKDFVSFSTLLAKPMEGTLSDRLLNISLKLRAKTGTASNISTIAGYIDAYNGKKYSFAIMIQNHNTPVVEVKKFEDKIINEIYRLN